MGTTNTTTKKTTTNTKANAQREKEALELAQAWKADSRWSGITRAYEAEDVVRLRGSIKIEHTLARRGAEKLWKLMQTEPQVSALGALTGNQAVQQAQAGLKAIYLSGWQVADRDKETGEPKLADAVTFPEGTKLAPGGSMPGSVNAE
jgi:isocitrate lyase